MFEDAFVTLHRADSGINNQKMSLAILQYNMGMALHLLAESWAPTNVEALKLALKFYNWSLETLAENCYDGIMLDVGVVVLMAFFNNIGHIPSGGIIDAERESRALRHLVTVASGSQVTGSGNLSPKRVYILLF